MATLMKARFPRAMIDSQSASSSRSADDRAAAERAEVRAVEEGGKGAIDGQHNWTGARRQMAKRRLIMDWPFEEASDSDEPSYGDLWDLLQEARRENRRFKQALAGYRQAKAALRRLEQEKQRRRRKNRVRARKWRRKRKHG
jgi:hypothetical protein